MDVQVKVGVVGLGKMGLLHAGIVNSLPGATMTSVCEKDLFLSGAAGAITNDCRTCSQESRIRDTHRHTWLFEGFCEITGRAKTVFVTSLALITMICQGLWQASVFEEKLSLMGKLGLQAKLMAPLEQ